MSLTTEKIPAVYVLAGLQHGVWTSLDQTGVEDGDHEEAIAFLEGQKRPHAAKYEVMQVLSETEFSSLSLNHPRKN